MTLIAEKSYTAQDLLNDPNLAGFELVKGQLRERTMSKRSSAIGAKILTLLFNHASKSHEANVYPSDLGYDCFPDAGTTVRFADVSVIRAERDAEAGENPGYMPIPADLAVEVLSPNDRFNDMGEKVKDYLKAGFGLVWVVDPQWKYVHIYRRDGSVELLTADDEITGESALPSFRCKVNEFFIV